jgi:pimeloyl-ACP methyl ester carboxylesterase
VRFWLAIAMLLILVVAGTAYSSLPGNRGSGTFDTDPPTSYFHYKPVGTPRGRILVVHGLDATRNVMNILSFGLADAGFEVFSIDLPGHGESRAGFNAVQARTVVGSALDELGTQTAVVGHSFGGAMLLDVAADRRIGRMVLFSPAPTPLQSLQAEHVLLLTGQLEPGRIRAFAPQVESNATGAFEYRDLPWTGHSGALFRADVIASVAQWLGGDSSAIHTKKRLGLLGVMFLSSMALGVTLLGGIHPAHPVAEPATADARLTLLYYIAASLLAAGTLAVVNVAAWLRIFALDYLIGLFFLAGVLVLSRCKGLKPGRPRLWVGLGAAAYIILVPGFLVASELIHTVPSGGRWWRFLGILALGLPMFLADEYLLRSIRPALKAEGAAILSRILVGAIAVSGALILNRQSAFLLLVTHLAVIFWIALWVGAGLVRTRADPFTAACFAAAVQAWYFASLLVMV